MPARHLAAPKRGLSVIQSGGTNTNNPLKSAAREDREKARRPPNTTKASFAGGRCRKSEAKEENTSEKGARRFNWDRLSQAGEGQTQARNGEKEQKKGEEHQNNGNAPGNAARVGEGSGKRGEARGESTTALFYKCLLNLLDSAIERYLLYAVLFFF